MPALSLDALGARRHLCAGDELLSARADADTRLRRGGAAQHHARPSRPARRHGRLYRRQGAHLRAPARSAMRAVVGIDDEICRGIADGSPRAARSASCRSRPSARRRAASTSPTACSSTTSTARRGACSICARSSACPAGTIGRTRPPPMPPRACLGVDADGRRRRGIASFPGLAHRQELIAVIDGVRYVNDSKATNADAAAKALACYDDIYWIAGGEPKEGGIASLAPFFPRIRHAFLIGEAARRSPRRSTARCPTRCAARSRAPLPPRATRRAAERERDRAAVAGLRLLRPVQRFRGARRRVPRPRRSACRERGA